MPSPIGLVHPVAQVRDLARDLGVSCTQILRIASTLGLPVSCPSSVVTLQQAEQIESVCLRTDSLLRVPTSRSRVEDDRRADADGSDGDARTRRFT